MIPYGNHWIDEDDIQAVVDVLRSDYITQGPKIFEFEKKLSLYCGSKYTVAFNSGTSALHAAYFSLNVRQGSEFITSPISFVSTANAGLYLNLKPIFCDVETGTGNIDVTQIESLINEKTKFIVPVHYSGHPADMDKIYGIAQKYNLNIIEDAAHAFGAKYKNKPIGSCQYSDMTILSFHPVKHITTGEGGAVLTNNQDYYKKLLMFRTHGITKDDFKYESPGEWYYEQHYLGYNYRMTDIQAALGISQLKKVDIFIKKRHNIAQKYNEAFSNNPFFSIPLEKEYAFSSFHLYFIRLKDSFKKDKLYVFNYLRERGIGVQVHYIPIYYHPFYEKIGFKSGICPNAENFYNSVLSIPIFPLMTNSDIDKIISILMNIN